MVSLYLPRYGTCAFLMSSRICHRMDDAIIAAIFLYAKMWSPSMIFALLIVVALGGASTQLIMGTGR